MRCIVTGAAGFIGSHLCEKLLEKGFKVIGMDSLSENYSKDTKMRNISGIANNPHFRLVTGDLAEMNLENIIEKDDVIFHLAAATGLRGWDALGMYLRNNLTATHRLLEEARKAKAAHFIQGSTSSVYGSMAKGDENSPPKPCSPYGLSKLAAEYLCRNYSENMPVTILRIFSAYGPRQRPDMAYYIFIDQLLHGRPLHIYGSGEQSRSNTYVSDVINGISLALEKKEKSAGEIFNIGGGEVVTVNDAVKMLERITGRNAAVKYEKPKEGDQLHTEADTGKAKRILGYNPKIRLEEGLRNQVEWMRSFT